MRRRYWQSCYLLIGPIFRLTFWIDCWIVHMFQRLWLKRTPSLWVSSALIGLFLSCTTQISNISVLRDTAIRSGFILTELLGKSSRWVNKAGRLRCVKSQGVLQFVSLFMSLHVSHVPPAHQRNRLIPWPEVLIWYNLLRRKLSSPMQVSETIATCQNLRQWYASTSVVARGLIYAIYYVRLYIHVLYSVWSSHHPC